MGCVVDEEVDGVAVMLRGEVDLACGVGAGVQREGPTSVSTRLLQKDENIITSDIIIKNIHEHPKIIGIGETGLDFYYNNSDKDKQINSFIKHIEASIKTNVPLIIHSREAEEDTFNILNNYRDKNLKIK